MKKTNKKKSPSYIFIRNSFIIFIGLFASLVLFYFLNILDYKLNFLNFEEHSTILSLSVMFVISVIFGAVTALLSSRDISQPYIDIKNATNEIAKGNFDIQIKTSKNKNVNEIIKYFNKMASDLKNNEILKADFISNISHEFKTPLAVIQSYTKALRSPDLDNKTKEKYEQVIDNNIQKLNNLVSNILNLSKIENQELVVNKTEFLIDEQIRQCIVSLEPEWQKKNINFELDLPATKYWGSKELINQVWQNLIGNAIKFSEQNGEINISIKNINNQIFVNIKDNGIGMDQETQKRIYEKFYQADSSRASEGNGLGLALVKRIIAISGGEILVTSEKGQGSCFTVVL